MIMVREEGDLAPDTVEYRHGLTPPMRDARRRRFRREPDLNVHFYLDSLIFFGFRCCGTEIVSCPIYVATPLTFSLLTFSYGVSEECD